MKLLGHVIRADNGDPLRQVTFREGNIRNARAETIRSGKPKMEWSRERKKQIWKKIRHEMDNSDKRKPDKRRKYEGEWS